ncbi:hypothetical protein J2S90_000101 [Arthrobacter bambusae]|uniref:Uncharacterized protein n=1 Tax=Arthrobacter bambusae TaxID=1338426 RepID=A0AAW8D2N3_9MICC|nr:hypothetical protein [Arthrobacter bambusae]MDQ0128845.1 hypothetical protein [Arthrobacter bambusae]MDQ0180186.1 hypothetical protein [Arthrobacter bambusae]
MAVVIAAAGFIVVVQLQRAAFAEDERLVGHDQFSSSASLYLLM